jgi:integrase
MIDFSQSPDFRQIGKHLARQRKTPRGSLKRIGRDKWIARWHRWEGDKRKPIKRYFDGFLAKADAQEYMRELIVASASAPLSTIAEPTFNDVWNRFVAMKAADWETANRISIESIMRRAVLSGVGVRPIKEMTREALQGVLNKMHAAGMSTSAMMKARLYIKATMEFAADEDLITKNPAAGKKISVPRKSRKAVNKRFLSVAEIAVLDAAYRGEQNLVFWLFLVGGFRPGELFALRTDDLGLRPFAVRVDEAVKQAERAGPRKIGEPKTLASDGFVALPADLNRRLCAYAATRKPGLLFPSAAGTPMSPKNYLNRVLKPISARAGVPGVTFQALRRTCSTHFRGDVKSSQAQLRHATPMLDAKEYMQVLTEDHRRAVEALWTQLRTDCSGSMDTVQ